MNGIIFDLDGTLLNTIADLGNSMNRILKKYNLPEHPLDAYTLFVGNGMKKLVERAVGAHPQFDEILEAYLDEYQEHYLDDSLPYNNVIETLKTLNERKVPIAICTNKKQVYTDNIVEHFFKDIKFEAVMGDQFDGKHKPNPHSALICAEKMNCKPENILFVGDSNVDMQTAKNANMTPIGVSWGFRSVEELESEGASQIIDNMSEILNLV